MPHGAQWADVQKYSDNRARAAEVAGEVGELTDLDVVPRENGYSVERNHRQVAVFTVDVDGEYRWGWVEHADGNGRTDFTDLTPFVDAIVRNTTHEEHVHERITRTTRLDARRARHAQPPAASRWSASNPQR